MHPESALDRIKKWHRKYRWFEISNHGSVQPGDGDCVSLQDRKTGQFLVVDDWDLIDIENDYWPTIADLVTYALDRWDVLYEKKEESGRAGQAAL